MSTGDALTPEQADTFLGLVADHGLCPVLDWDLEHARLLRRGPLGSSYVTRYGGFVSFEHDGSLRYFGEDGQERAAAIAPAWQSLVKEWRLVVLDEDLVFVQPGVRGRLSSLAG
jgi:hypothetical protein